MINNVDRSIEASRENSRHMAVLSFSAGLAAIVGGTMLSITGRPEGSYLITVGATVVAGSAGLAAIRKGFGSK